MPISGLAALPPFPLVVASPFTPTAASTPITFHSYLERQSFHDRFSQNDHGGNMQFHRVDQAPVNVGQYLRPRQRRNTAPRWTRPPAVAGIRPTINRPQQNVTPAPPAVLRSKLSPTHHRAQTLIAQVYSEIFRCTPKQANEKFQQADRTLYQEWRNLSSINQMAWTPTADHQPRSAYDLAHATTLLTSHLLAYPNRNDALARSVARIYLINPPTIETNNAIRAHLYQSVLQRELHWIDPDKVRARHLSAVQVLQTVCRYRRPDIATRAGLATHLQQSRDVIIDEAALIFFYAQADLGGIAQDAPIDVVRAQYVSTLIDEWQDAALGQALMPSVKIAPAHARFWFDGAVMQNARGKDIEQIVSELVDNAPYEEEGPTMQRLIRNDNQGRLLLGQPDGAITAERRTALTRKMHGNTAALPRYAQRANTVNIAGVWLTRDELYAVVVKTMRNLMLDTIYPSGTPLHAIATTMLRMAPQHGVACETPNNPAELVAAYNRLKHAWNSNPRYHISPALLTARYLAQSSDVLLLNSDSPLTRDQQISAQEIAPIVTALKNIDIDPTTLLNDLAGIGTLNIVDRLQIYNGVRDCIERRKRSRETISYSGAPDLIRKHEDYLHERLLAMAPPPAYDENFLIDRILRRELGMTDADLGKRTQTVIGPHPWKTLSMQITPHEEFVMRSPSSSMHPMMHFNGISLDTKSALKTAKADAARALSAHPVIQAKSKELARRHATSPDREDRDAVRDVLVKNIMGEPQTLLIDDLLDLFTRLFGSPTITAIVDALSSGEPRQILGLFPFVVPLYDIGEGVMHGNRQRAIDGMIHFGEDALLTLLGAGAERIMLRQIAGDAEAMAMARARMSPAERAGVDTLHDMGTLIPAISPAQLRPSRIALNNDAFAVHTEADTRLMQTNPKTLEAAISIGASHAGQERRMLFLENEQRSVPAIPVIQAEDEFCGN
jgi:hypothetical protein